MLLCALPSALHIDLIVDVPQQVIGIYSGETGVPEAVLIAWSPIVHLWMPSPGLAVGQEGSLGMVVLDTEQ